MPFRIAQAARTLLTEQWHRAQCDSAGSGWRLRRVVRRQGGDDLDRFHTDPDDLSDEADDVLGVVGVVGVRADAGAFVFLHPVLIDDPLDRAAVAEAVVEDLRRDASQGKRVVDLDRSSILAQPHLLDDVAQRLAGRLDPLQGPGLERFVLDVELRKPLARLGEGAEPGREVGIPIRAGSVSDRSAAAERRSPCSISRKDLGLELTESEVVCPELKTDIVQSGTGRGGVLTRSDRPPDPCPFSANPRRDREEVLP